MVGAALEKFLEHLMFRSRWLLAPLYVGLILAIVLLAIKFIQSLVHVLPQLWDLSEEHLTLALLTLVDMVLLGNLLLMVIFAGYENFVSKIDVGDHPDRPAWMGRIDSTGLKLKLIASIVAISSVEMLKVFLNVENMSDREILFMGGVHLMFVISGLLLAIMDYVAARTEVLLSQIDHEPT
jgi:uncharacterized protein (TIGR00645 family)